MKFWDLSHHQQQELRERALRRILRRLTRRNYKPLLPTISSHAGTTLEARSNACVLAEWIGDALMRPYINDLINRNLQHCSPSLRKAIEKIVCENVTFDHVAFCAREHDRCSFSKSGANLVEIFMGAWGREAYHEDAEQWISRTFLPVLNVVEEAAHIMFKEIFGA
ncbi:hypothetical protein R3P38DRAFT_3173666 [Favolaschia claudopus]|uniref:RNase III domain-containing protein n=1 Tax=Favolaschia claudopus TaxID=2862362 RepID=A0AAW0DFI1_9AGAR